MPAKSNPASTRPVSHLAHEAKRSKQPSVTQARGAKRAKMTQRTRSTAKRTLRDHENKSVSLRNLRRDAWHLACSLVTVQISKGRNRNMEPELVEKKPCNCGAMVLHLRSAAVDYWRCENAAQYCDALGTTYEQALSTQRT